MDIREEIFEQERGERQYYLTADIDKPVLLPLTRDGFEALLERVAQSRNIPVDDASRMVIAGYVHHIENEQDSISIDVLAKVLHKSVSNSTTWRIDQEIKIKRNLAIKEAADAAKAEAEQGKVISINPSSTELN